MDNVINEEMSTELMEGVSDVLAAVRRGSAVVNVNYSCFLVCISVRMSVSALTNWSCIS